jgi:hypothetical protein
MLAQGVKSVIFKTFYMRDFPERDHEGLPKRKRQLRSSFEFEAGLKDRGISG